MEKLSINEVLNLKGGQNVQQYCVSVSALILDNWEKWSHDQREAAVDAYKKHCM